MGDLSDLQIVGLSLTAIVTLWGIAFEIGRARFDPPHDRRGR